MKFVGSEYQRTFDASRAESIDTEGVVVRVKKLFKGQRNLILGFKAFLPKGYEYDIGLEDEEPPSKRVVDFDDALNFAINNQFMNNEQVYKSFFDPLNMYRMENMIINEVYDVVSHLFEDRPNLLEEFTRFLSEGVVHRSKHI